MVSVFLARQENEPVGVSSKLGEKAEMESMKKIEATVG
jgi:hypothetical protein